MTQSQKLVRAKLSVLQLAQLLNNVSQACRITGVSRQHFYDLKQAYEEGGIEALEERSQRRPNHKNRVSQDLEDAIVAVAEEFPAFGQVRAANELRQRGFHISAGGVRCVWLRHDLETFKKRLKRLEAKSAEEGTVFTEAQVQALERGMPRFFLLPTHFNYSAPTGLRSEGRTVPGALPQAILLLAFQAGYKFDLNRQDNGPRDARPPLEDRGSGSKCAAAVPFLTSNFLLLTSKRLYA